MDKAIIVDLDGTLCNVDHRLHYVAKTTKDGKKNRKNWKRFFEELINDVPNDNVLWLVELAHKSNIKIVFCSGRPKDMCEQLTIEWLNKYLSFKDYTLFMRNAGDYRKDDIVKKEIYENNIKNHFDIRLVVDDRPSVIKAWKELELPVLDCGNGKDF